MTAPEEGTGSHRPIARTLLPYGPALLVGGRVGRGLVVWGFAADTWSSGSVSAVMGVNHPAVTVTTSERSGVYGLYAGLDGVEELSPSGATVSSAQFNSINWTVTNSSTASSLGMSYHATLPVAAPTAASPGGSTSVFVNFTSVSSPSSPAQAIGMQVAVVGWPWTSASDLVGLSMPLSPNNASLESLSAQPGSNMMTCADSDSGVNIEYFSWANNASMVGTDGAGTLPVATASDAGGPAATTVSVDFAGGSAGLSQLHFNTEIGLLPTPAPVPTSYYEVAGAGGIVVVAVAAVLQFRAGRRPPSLEAAR
jgi:hypothetical protein